MKLTEEQKIEIRNFLTPIKYRETYDELYDHILNLLADKEGSYNINEVVLILNNDFGGYVEICKQEKLHRKDLGKKYRKQFRQEMLNTFKWPGILANLCVLALCGLIYYSCDGMPFNKKFMCYAITGCAIGVAVFGYSKILIDRYKYSIMDNYFGNSCLWRLLPIMNFCNIVINSNPGRTTEINENWRILLLLSLFFFGSIYVRAFIKLYTSKYKILTA